MKIYLDIVFLVNFGINFIFIYIIQLIFNDKINYFKTIIASSLATIMLIAFLFNYIVLIIFKIVGGFLIILVGLGFEKLAIKTSLFYLLEFGLTGIVSSFKITGWYLIIAIIIVALLFMIQSFKKQSIFINNLKYNVSVTFFEKTINLEGFLDTGNLTTIDNLPVIYVDKKHYKTNLQIYKFINVNSIVSVNKIPCYLPKQFYLYVNDKKVEKHVLIAFIDLKENFDCLLNYHLFSKGDLL